MKVLVTGASGFVGNHVVRELLGAGHDVIATCNNPERAGACDWFGDVRYIHQDLKADVADYFALFERPELLIHLAWEGLCDFKSFVHMEQNLLWNWLFIRNMVEHGLRDVTAIGTCLEYGMQTGMLSEEDEPIPTTPYGLAKDCLRRFLEQLRRTVEFNLKWARLFYLYGPGQDPRSLLCQLEAALCRGQKKFNMSKGDQIRDYLPIETAARYIVKIALQNEVTGIVNCCSGRPVTVMELVRRYIRERNKDIELNPGYYSYPDYEPMSFWGSTDKLRLIIGAGQ